MFGIVGDDRATEATLAAELRRVTPEYFGALDVSLARGRMFAPTDRDSTPPVAIVNASFVEKYLAGRDPLTTRIQRHPFPPVDIVGVVPDTHDGGASEDPGPMVYLPFGQSAGARVTFVISTTLAGRQATEVLRAAVRSVDPGLPIDRAAPVAAMLSESLGEERFRAVVLGTMTVLAIIIACVGIYGVTAYLVQQHARDVAIRMALGATQPRIVAQLLGGTTTWIFVGVVAGVVASWGGGAYFARRFPELAPADTSIYFLVALALVAVGAIAGAVPTVRASRASPLRALRGD
jgi:hypothetical protein